jgi:hypothetical protein
VGPNRKFLESNHRRWLGALATLATVGLLTSATFAGAITPGEPFTVSPSAGGPFTVVDVSGSNCTDGPSPFVTGTVVGTPEIGVVADFTATPDGAGDWATTFTVAPNKPSGLYRVTATCWTDANLVDGDDYGEQSFTILEGEHAAMTVSPLRARAGGDVIVSVSGTLCKGQDALADVGIFFRDAEEADELVARRTFTPDADGNWSGQLTIEDSLPAVYRVATQCLVDGAQFFLYDPVDIVLTVPAALPPAPVSGQPSFTG